MEVGEKVRGGMASDGKASDGMEVGEKVRVGDWRGC